MAEAVGSASNEDTRCMSRGGENLSTNAALWPLDVYGLISMVLRVSTFALVMSSW